MPVNSLSVAFASEGGIVAVLSVIRRVLDRGPSERVMVFCGTPDGEHSEVLEELLALKDRHLQRLSLSFVTNREPDDSELLTGTLDGAKVSALNGKLFDAGAVGEFIVCGSQTLIADVTAALAGLGVDRGRIHAEDLAASAPALGATQPDDLARAAAAGSAPAKRSAAPETRVELVMDGRRRSFNMLTGTESILDAAARAGVDLPFSCRAGVCSTCRTKLVRGEVDLAQNYALEDWELAQGFILACQAHAKTPEIELTYDEK
jgi:ring-1,2-phenylacetyl-CoA epoxidase subunit PaaE